MEKRSLGLTALVGFLVLGAWADDPRRVVSHPAPARIERA